MVYKTVEVLGTVPEIGIELDREKETGMEIQIRYYSQTGNTRKLAEAIAQTIHISAETIEKPIKEKTDLLFLGGAMYAFGLDPKLKAYIKNLDKDKVKKAAVFCDSALMRSVGNKIVKLLKEKDIPVCNDIFYCKGQYKGTAKGHPDKNDMENVKEFAASMIKNM